MRLLTSLLFIFVMASSLTAQRTPLAKDNMIRAAYLASNPAQAVKDPATGEARGVVVDLARELERTRGVKLTLVPSVNPQAVIDAVRKGEAEIGFVAYNPERAGPVEFSKPYLLVNQTFLVKDDSPIRSIADIDRQGRKLGATRADSIALYLGRTLKQGQLVQLDDSSPAAVFRMLREGGIDAFGANLQRLGGEHVAPDLGEVEPRAGEHDLHRHGGEHPAGHAGRVDQRTRHVGARQFSDRWVHGRSGQGRGCLRERVNRQTSP